MDKRVNSILRNIPSIDELLKAQEVVEALELLPRELVVDAARAEIEELRQAVIASDGKAELPDDIAKRVSVRAKLLLAPSMQRVVNATGIVIHTNLGRSVMADEAVNAVTEAAKAYSTLEYDIDAMARGSRHDHCERLICALTGAEAAIAVNNNAAAVMMVLTEFAKGRDAVVSRGELVEIGGSFRIPDIMSISGAKMVEVGTTNKTHAADYANVLSDDTAMLLKVHTSNFQLVGFVESVSVPEMREMADEVIAKRKSTLRWAMEAKERYDGVKAEDSLIVYADLGSGALVTMDGVEGASEPPAGRMLAEGADLVSFSGDKLLGGPQAGIIIGRKELIDRLKKNPLARVLRLDKLTIAALEATLRIYLDSENVGQRVPTLRMLTAPDVEVKEVAKRLAARLKRAMPKGRATVEVVGDKSYAGGGALPMCAIPTYCVRVKFADDEVQSCCEYLVRGSEVPVVARVKDDALFFDARTLLGKHDEDVICKAMAAYLAS